MCEQILLMVTWLNYAQFTKLHTDKTYPTVPWKYREYTLKGKEQGRNRFKQEMNEVKMYQPTPPLTHTSVCRVWSSHRGVICLLHENRERWHWCDNETHPAAQTNSLSFPNWQVIRKQSAADWPHRKQYLSHLSGEIALSASFLHIITAPRSSPPASNWPPAFISLHTARLSNHSQQRQNVKSAALQRSICCERGGTWFLHIMWFKGLVHPKMKISPCFTHP